MKILMDHNFNTKVIFNTADREISNQMIGGSTSNSNGSNQIIIGNEGTAINKTENKTEDQTGENKVDGSEDQTEGNKLDGSEDQTEGNKEEGNEDQTEGNKVDGDEDQTEGNKVDGSEDQTKENKEEGSEDQTEGNKVDGDEEQMEGNKEEGSEEGTEGNKEEGSVEGTEGNKDGMENIDGNFSGDGSDLSSLIGMDGNISEPKESLLSNWYFIIGISAGTLVIGAILGGLLALKKIKKGIELYED